MKKKLMMALSLVLVAAVSITGTIAWLTAQTGAVTNTFTVGKITMDMDEAKTDEFGVKADPEERVKANSYKLMPGHTYAKDPTVYINADSEKCYVFIHVKNEIEGIEAEGTTIASQITTTNQWTALAGHDGVYYKVQDAVGKTADRVALKVFDTFKIKDDAILSDYEGKQIVINACAVQHDGMADAAAAFKACPDAFFTATGLTRPTT